MAGVYWGCIGIVEKKMETIIVFSRSRYMFLPSCFFRHGYSKPCDMSDKAKRVSEGSQCREPSWHVRYVACAPRAPCCFYVQTDSSKP